MVGRDFTVSLAGKDLIVNTEAVGRHLSEDWPANPLAHLKEGKDSDDSEDDNGMQSQSQSTVLVNMADGIATPVSSTDGDASGALTPRSIDEDKQTVTSAPQEPIKDISTITENKADDTIVIDETEWKSREWKGEGIEVLWWPDLDHAQVLERRERRAKLVGIMRGYTAQGLERSGDEGREGGKN